MIMRVFIGGFLWWLHLRKVCLDKLCWADILIVKYERLVLTVDIWQK